MVKIKTLTIAASPLPFMYPYLMSDEEISQICYPLTQPTAKCNHLKKIGIAFKQRPDGNPIVIRAHVYTSDDMPVPLSMRSSEPNRDALMKRLGRKI